MTFEGVGYMWRSTWDNVAPNWMEVHMFKVKNLSRGSGVEV